MATDREFFVSYYAEVPPKNFLTPSWMGHGNGNFFLPESQKVTMEQIQKWEDEIKKKKGYKSVRILNYQLLNQ